MISAPRASATWRPSLEQLEQRRADPRAAVGVGHARRRARRARVSTSGVSSALVTRVSRVPNVNASARSVERTTAWAKRSRSGLCARSEPETSIEQQHAPRPPRPLAPGELEHLAARPVRGVEHALQVELAPAPRAPRAPPGHHRERARQRGAAARRARRGRPREVARERALVAQVDRAGVQAGALARLERLELPLVAGVRRRGLALVVVGGAGCDSSTSRCPPRNQASKTTSKISKSSARATSVTRARQYRASTSPGGESATARRKSARFSAPTRTPASSSERRKPCRCSRARSLTAPPRARPRRAPRPPAP